MTSSPKVDWLARLRSELPGLEPKTERLAEGGFIHSVWRRGCFPRAAYTRSSRGPWKQLYFKVAAPYGVWLCADSREVLFNRDYTPIYQRADYGSVSTADHKEWVPFIDQRWFYTDRYPLSSEEHMEIMNRFRNGERLAELVLPLPVGSAMKGQI